VILGVGSQKLNCDNHTNGFSDGYLATEPLVIAEMALRKPAWATTKNTTSISTKNRSLDHTIDTLGPRKRMPWSRITKWVFGAARTTS